MKQIINVLSLTLVVSVLVFSSFIGLEPQLGLAATASDSVTVTQAVTSGVSITAPANVTMNALTTTQLTSVGTTTWTVITNSASGYTLGVQAAITGGALFTGTTYFTDYTTTPTAWSVSGAYEFGFAPFGNDVTTATYGTGSLCESTANVPSASLKYVGFKSTDTAIAASSGVTNQAGTATTICYAAEQDTVWAPSGTYTATITATATVT